MFVELQPPEDARKRILATGGGAGLCLQVARSCLAGLKERHALCSSSTTAT